MLCSKNKLKLITWGLFLASFFILTSCLPSQSPGVQTNSQTSSGSPTNNNNDREFTQPIFPHAQNFLQEGSNTTTSSLSVGLNFNDSFLIRGASLSTYLSKVSTSTVMCLVGRYTYAPGKNRYLVLSAKPMIFTDVARKTREYYLQVQPANDLSNQNDCLTYNLQSVLQSSSADSLHFSLQQLCTNCTTAVSSAPLKIYFSTGEEASALNLGSQRLVIAGNSQQNGNSCNGNSYCQSIGFNCCLESQCVNNGAIRPSAYSLPGFSSAQEDVRQNPNNILRYPEYYFICTDQTGTTPLPEPEIPDVDYEATIRLREMKQLYDCLNTVDDEFSYCTVKFLNASKRASKTFSSADPEFNQTSDINFTSVNDHFKGNKYENNIARVIYSNEVLYDQNLHETPTGGTLNTTNDNLTAAQSFTLTKPLSSNAKDDNLYLTYKVDGTCKKMTSALAQCTKSYIFQSQDSDKYKTTYHNGSQIFKLPSYADFLANATIKVEVSGIIVPEDPTNWRRELTYEVVNGVNVPRPKIIFTSRLYQNQTIKITYYVKSQVNELVAMREIAQSRVNTMCQCSGINCNIAPEYSDSSESNIINYRCVYPSNNDNQPPVNQTVYVSNKNAPHRYYDVNGVNYDANFETAPAQEGNPFKYDNNDILKPNNNTCKTGECFVGFNEIYGNFDAQTASRALPAKKIKVKKDTSYDIMTINGIFSSCPNCGTDYYNSLQKIFPNSFDNFGAGYTPDLLTSSRIDSNRPMRADDLLFGRACFVPATMIPWTHEIQDNVRDQRRNRLAAQHFLFANGYQRDWYGFDYGSLIGSFDGVTWFSIGSSRRIRAKGDYLYLAVNSYFHDLNSDNSYQVSITESSPFSSPDKPDHDTESDGAQCQRSHFCSKDDDCYRQLGYEYTCQNVAEIMTNWPVFDQAGTETINVLHTSLATLVGGTNGQTRRCVYRGRGAPCVANLTQLNNINEADIFNRTKSLGQLSCSSNNACTSLNAQRFNNRIARFANTPTAQNLQKVVTDGDTVGLGAKIIGRPFDYNGKYTANSAAKDALAATKVGAICTPGVELSLAATTYDLNLRTPATPIGKSDKLFGVGPTLTGSESLKYLSACPATDESGYSIHEYNLSLTSPLLLTHTTNQNMSSNLLDIKPLNDLKIYSSESTATEDKQVKTIGYQKNVCLRAPGSSCFSDLECAPSSLIGDKFRSASNLATYLNQAEIDFWKEDLICGNPSFKYVGNNVLNANFNILENKCCRDVGKKITVYTETDTSAFKWCKETQPQVQVAGLNTAINNKSRYSRVHTVYDSMTCNMNEISSSKKFALSVAKNGATYTNLNQILGQYKTLDTLNSRTCCTQNWVRSFHPLNGGGHKFENSKTQKIDKTIFKYISWFPNDDVTLGAQGGPFECDEDNFTNISCEIRSLTSFEQKKYLEWVASLELIGIPQVAIGTNEEVSMIVDDQQNEIPGAIKPPLPKTIRDITTTTPDFVDGPAQYYSAANYDKFDISSSGLKKIFSENEFNCCVPSGNEVPDSVGDSQCCTGYVANVDGPRRCCLPDFTNVTLYLNRYVSSEGRGLPDHSYDEKTGYIKDPAAVVNLANQKSLCCSGTAMTGVAISKLPIPIFSGRFLPPNAENTVTRFNYRTDSVDNNEETGLIGDIFDAGVRWNNHVYCVPANFTQ